MDGTEGIYMYTTLFVYTIQLRNNEKEHQLYSVQQYIYMYTTSLQIVQVIYMIVHLHLKLYMYTYTCTCALGVRCCFAFVCFFLSSFLSLIQNIHKSFTYCTVNIQYILYVYIYIYTTSLHIVQVHVYTQHSIQCSLCVQYTLKKTFHTVGNKRRINGSVV